MKRLAVLALGTLLLAGCGAVTVADEKPTPALTNTEVDEFVTAKQLAALHGINAVEVEPSMWGLTAATVNDNTLIETYTGRDARDIYIAFARKSGAFVVGGESNNTVWTCTMVWADSSMAEVRKVAEALAK